MTLIPNGSKLLRQTRLLYTADRVRFCIHALRSAGKRNAFRKAHPEAVLPPDYLMYESFRLDYEKYYFGGQHAAAWVAASLRPWLPAAPVVLDWGCGPARVVRHLPELLPAGSRVFGTDYNSRSIAWNSAHIPNVNFTRNALEPPLPFENAGFDAVYGISIFTHLSEELHFQWFAELVRITKHGGVILLTLQGNAFREKLTQTECHAFDEGRLVVRGKTRIGHRTYSAFHPEAWVRKFVQPHEVVSFVPGTAINGQPAQDTWIIRVS
jgi:SAM-dependent methyltransferase